MSKPRTFLYYFKTILSYTAGIVPFKMILECHLKTGSGKGLAVECVFWTEPKATCRLQKNQPNAHRLEGIYVFIYPFTSDSFLGGGTFL